MNERALTRSRTSAKCRLSRCSLFRILSISHCRSSIMDSRTETRDSAVSTLLCNLENYIPKTGIWKKTKKDHVRKRMPYITIVHHKSHKINPCLCIIIVKIEIEDVSPSFHCMNIKMKSQIPLTILDQLQS